MSAWLAPYEESTDINERVEDEHYPLDSCLESCKPRDHGVSQKKGYIPQGPPPPSHRWGGLWCMLSDDGTDQGPSALH